MSTVAQSSLHDRAVRIVGRRAHRPLASRLDYASTYATALLTSGCSLAAFHLAHRHLGETGFAEFAIIRRAVAVLAPLLSLGMAVAIAKGVACRSATLRAADAVQFLSAGAAVTMLSLSTFALAVFLFPEQASLLCTGSPQRANLVLNLAPLVGGLVLTMCCGAYWRGRMQIRAVNALQLTCVGVIPAVVLLCVDNVESFLLWSGYAVTTVSGLAILVVSVKSPRAIRRVPYRDVQWLLRFGAPRTPGDLAFYGLLAAPAIVASHQAGLQRGGEVAYALALLTMLQQLVAPLSTLLLPEAAYLIHSSVMALGRLMSPNRMGGLTQREP